MSYWDDPPPVDKRMPVVNLRELLDTLNKTGLTLQPNYVGNITIWQGDVVVGFIDFQTRTVELNDTTD